VLPNGMSLDILNMAAYQTAVLVWLYFALAAKKNLVFDSPALLTELGERAAELGRIVR
jgi:hypothetical protein